MSDRASGLGLLPARDYREHEHAADHSQYKERGLHLKRGKRGYGRAWAISGKSPADAKDQRAEHQIGRDIGVLRYPPFGGKEGTSSFFDQPVRYGMNENGAYHDEEK